MSKRTYGNAPYLAHFQKHEDWRRGKGPHPRSRCRSVACAMVAVACSWRPCGPPHVPHKMRDWINECIDIKRLCLQCNILVAVAANPYLKLYFNNFA
jgi:hypothetical protein